jgi:hypothetical protein
MSSTANTYVSRSVLCIYCSHSHPQTSIPAMNYKKNSPAPIKIPNATFNRPKVQLVRTSVSSPDGSVQQPQRPPSQASYDEMTSAMSGRNLARALLGNSFVLSSGQDSARANKYRSGASNLTRSDSAVLPRGEHPYGLERSLSMNSDILSPGSSTAPDIPPVPPIPDLSNYMSPVKGPSPPNRSPRSVSPTVSPRSPVHPDSPIQADDGFASRPMTVASSVALLSALGYTRDSRGISYDFSSNRISKISEVPSDQTASPQPPMGPQDEDQGEEPSMDEEVEVEKKVEEGQLAESEQEQDLLVPKDRPTSQGHLVPPSPIPVTPSSATGTGFDAMLDYYQSDDMTSPGPFPVAATYRGPAFSPISEESSSQLSPPAPYKDDEDVPRPASRIVVTSVGPQLTISSPSGTSLDSKMSWYMC